MTDLEKVIIGLEHHSRCRCSFNKNDICPYWCEENDSASLCRDALELLKSHQPRVLTSSELQPDVLVWIEVPQSSEIWPALLRKTDWFGHPAWTMRGYALVVYYLHDGYGRDWRCWSAKPTYEQKEAAAWDD